MAKTGILVDTSIFIDIFRGNKKARDFIIQHRNNFYYSFVTKKELFKKRGLKTTDKHTMYEFLSCGKTIYIDQRILEGIRILAPLYRKKQINDRNDIIIAATAFVKKLPLATLNLKHFSFIKGLKLVHLRR